MPTTTKKSQKPRSQTAKKGRRVARLSSDDDIDYSPKVATKKSQQGRRVTKRAKKIVEASSSEESESSTENQPPNRKTLPRAVSRSKVVEDSDDSGN